jgi:hypothetical protein
MQIHGVEVRKKKKNNYTYDETLLQRRWGNNFKLRL